MDKKLNFDLLETFVAVAETGELKKAAEKIFRSHSAVSMQIQRLEKIVGATIIHRSTRGVTLTEKGQVLFNYSKRLLNLNKTAIAALREDDLTGRIAFGVPTDYARPFLTHFLPALRNRLPNLQPRITCGRSRNLRDKINAGELDIAIVAGEPGFSDEQFIGSERLVWAASHDYEYDNNEPMPIAVFDENCVLRDLTLSGLKESKADYAIVFSSPVLDNIADAVYNGIGVSLLPESLVPNAKAKVLTNDMMACKTLLKINLIWSSSMADNILNIVSACVKSAFNSNLSNIQ